MQRYLVFFSYIGTRFRGAQAQLPPNVTPRVPGATRLGDFVDRTTVQGLFNVALSRFRPLNTPVLMLSSRTDTGVHALCSSGHFDMLHPRHERGARYQPNFLVNGLNRYFDKAKAEIIVQRVLPVPDTFHSRYSAVSRAYLYRLGVVRPAAWLPGSDGCTVKAITPIGERHRSYIVGGEFSVARLRTCAALLSGEHDFRSFMGARREPQAELRTRRALQIDIAPGAASVYTPHIEFWDIHFRSRGFLFRQVRRTVGVLVACGRGRMTLDDVRRLLDRPDKASWNSAAATAPPHGLYLSRVTYRPEEISGSAHSGGPGAGAGAEAEAEAEVEAEAGSESEAESDSELESEEAREVETKMATERGKSEGVATEGERACGEPVSASWKEGLGDGRCGALEEYAGRTRG